MLFPYIVFIPGLKGIDLTAGNFGGKYDTQDGVTYGGSYEKNGVGVEYDNINGVKASVEKGPFSLSTDGKNSMLNFTLQLGKKNGGRIGFKNGGLASIL